MKKFLLISALAVSLFATNIETLKKEAQNGDINSLMKLGLMYESGDGVKQDLKLAKRYYSQAKELGSEDAKISLSLLELSSNDEVIKHLSNNVSIKNVTGLSYSIDIKDVKELVARAKRDDKDALFTLATLYDNGYGELKADSKKALLLYKKASKLGSKKAQELLEIKGE